MALLARGYESTQVLRSRKSIPKTVIHQQRLPLPARTDSSFGLSSHLICIDIDLCKRPKENLPQGNGFVEFTKLTSLNYSPDPVRVIGREGVLLSSDITYHIC